ncbi:type IA DNA topoisomerase [Oceanirhabdus sp. W0125-5]|uniref:type IA DNA topoisomerase n=1 Tax=Oceanirhabdus sp. W0125-5 TaxID=2999116 RepID=UPI0022F2FFDA|nr:type IA DNA topoisomerase [Oceanirhabdus sp. W0125-5]WBW99347.1 DNA topoisomerase III [Oceanirhabdus sp. W0125-5]
MGKALFIAEKPSVAREFGKILKISGAKRDGYIEGDKGIVTWCVGHLVSMSYPEVYDEKLKLWDLKDLPFIPDDFKYEIIPGVKKQFDIVCELLNRDDVDRVYVCTDSGREGEYIYRLVDMMSQCHGKEKKRVWIDSQTEEEILRGVKEAKDLSEYDSLSDSAFLRAKEDYLVGINFSRILTLLYGDYLRRMLNKKNVVIAVGRVMTCVLAMIVQREREIRNFDKTFFYKVECNLNNEDERKLKVLWKVVEGSKFYNTPKLYNENGFNKKEDCEQFINEINAFKDNGGKGIVDEVNKKKQKKSPPLLFNLAELQNECSKRYKIDPNKTLSCVQSLYEKKMVTYPRTDARVLSTAVAKEIPKMLKKLTGLKENEEITEALKEISAGGLHKGIEKKKYVDDKKITDHYAIIPTGEGLGNLNSLPKLEKDIYELIVRRFLAIFLKDAQFVTTSVTVDINGEKFYTSHKEQSDKGYEKVYYSKGKKKKDEEENVTLIGIKKGMKFEVEEVNMKEGETSPPKRYNTGSIILAMENAGKLIEDEELREQIKGSGIGTSATRAEILNKLVEKDYVNLNAKTQIITPSTLGELIFDVVNSSIPSLLNPKLTASWEKGLQMVVDNEIDKNIFMEKLTDYIEKNTAKALRYNKNIDLSKVFNETLKVSEINYINENNLGICPICKRGHVIKNKKGYGCTNWINGCKFFIGTVAGIEVELKEIKNLVKYGETSLIEGFKSKKGEVFNAKLAIRNGRISFLS